MVSQSGDEINLPLSPDQCLELLNARPYITNVIGGAGSPLAGISTSRQGLTNRYWLRFENDLVAYIPSDATLKSPAKFSLCLMSAVRRPIIIDKNIQTVWQVCDLYWMMACAQESHDSAGSLTSMLEEVLSEPEYVYSNGPMSGREVAAIFADEAKSLKYASDGHPHVAVQGSDGLYLYFHSLCRVWQQRFPKSVVDSSDLIATLYQMGFKPLRPWPTGDSDEHRISSIRMWRKRYGDSSSGIEGGSASDQADQRESINQGSQNGISHE